MIELGSYALYLVLVFAGYAAVAAIAGGSKRRPDLVRSAERAVYASFALLLVAALGVEAALLGDRFDLEFVAQNSSREQPLVFKLTALWGGQSGSLLLWALMIGGFSSLAVWQNRSRNRTLMPWVIAALMANLLFFAGLICFVRNPFQALPPEAVLSNGQGLNPLLQHPAMVIHPPLLYLGFVGFVVPFAFAFAALVTGELGPQWFRTTRRWTITSWCFLGYGIMLGGRWAYEVLGWGGYWAWDPVENASLMPWLIATAYLHSVMIQEKRGMLKIWNLALIGLTYSMCLFGTFLTRSGAVQSVHSFTASGWFGFVFLAYVMAVAGVFFTLLYYRIPELRSASKLDSVLSREASFLMNNWAFLALCGIVLYGTLYPVISEAVTGAEVQYGPPFFQRYAGPIALFLLLLTGVGPLIAWRRATWVNLRKSFAAPAVCAVLTAAVVLALGVREFYPVAFAGLCAFVTGTVLEEYWRGIRARMRRGEGPLRAFLELVRRNQRRYGGYVVHLAVVLIFIGFAGSVFNLEETRLLQPGETWHIGRYTLEYRQARPLRHPHYAGAVARVAVYEEGEPIGMLLPEKRMYFQQETPATMPAVASSMREDLYVILAGLEPDQSAAFKVYINPLVIWIWIGGGVFLLGNALVLWPLPERQTREVPARRAAQPA
jgi:cytochrome c-type biogenesis protein CcmF